MLGFPSPLGPDIPAPDEFALQFWPEQKLYNAGLVLGRIRMLVGGPGGGSQVSYRNLCMIVQPRPLCRTLSEGKLMC